MTDTTTHGKPFPEGTDLIINGNEAIQALAEYSDVWAYMDDPATTSIPSGVQTTIKLDDGTFGIDTSSQFALVDSDTAIEYTGPTRFFLVNCNVGIAGAGPGKYFQLYHTGGSGSGTNVGGFVEVAPGPKTTGILLVSTGDKLHVEALQSSGGAVNANVRLIVVAL